MIGYCKKSKQIVLSEAECHFCKAPENGIYSCLSWDEKIPDDAHKKSKQSSE